MTTLAPSRSGRVRFRVHFKAAPRRIASEIGERTGPYRVRDRRTGASAAVSHWPGFREAGRRASEATIQAAWRRLPHGAAVPGADGAVYTILYPGRPADGPGPDFRDAVLRGPDGRVERGDIEIHVRVSGWRSHGHHRDPRYNGVLFHVTGEWPVAAVNRGARDPAAVLTASGRPLCALVLAPPYPAAALPGPGRSESPANPVAASGNRALPADLAAAGDQRFLGKSAGLSITLRKEGGDAAAWAAVLDCLGYSRNRRGFRRVAGRLPWGRLRDAMEAGASARSLLLWAGGFGPKPGGLRGLQNSLAAPAWVAGGRPDNRPERRLAAAAALAGRWRERGPLENIIEAVRAATGPADLIETFRAGGDRSDGRALIGRGRAGEIVVNAALPLAHAWSILADRWDVTGKALQLYRDHPKLPGNAITREMAALLAGPGPAHGSSPGPSIKICGAREQQGLILMYRAMTAGPLFINSGFGVPPRSPEPR